MKCPNCKTELTLCEADAKPATQIIPWMECNSPASFLDRWGWHRPDIEQPNPTPMYLEHCIDGLEYWQDVTDTAMVMTQPPYIDDVFPVIREHTSMNIIGGVKVHSFVESALNWQMVANSAERIVKHTGINKVILGCQTALTPFHGGDTLIDFDVLMESLTPLRETGIEFIWYPVAILPDWDGVPDLESRTSELVDVIASKVPNSTFVTSYNAWHQDRRQEQREQMIELVGADRTLDHLLTAVDGQWRYSDEPPRRIRTVQETITRIKAGFGDVRVCDVHPDPQSWVAVAREFAEAWGR